MIVPEQKTPVCLLSGFLGSGKTTLLNALLKKDEFAETLVIINEFGETSLDHLLVEKSAETIFELSNGCLCCSVRGELVDTLVSLDRSKFKRIFIETTGVADPLPVFQSIAFHPELVEKYQPASISIVVDAARGQDLIEQHEEAKKQLACADNIILSKVDLCDDISSVSAFIKSRNNTAIMIDDFESLNQSIFEKTINIKQPNKHHAHDHEHTSAYKSVVLETEKPLSPSQIAGFIHHLVSCYGENLLRVKGLALSEENPGKPLIVQTSGQILHDFTQLENWPNNNRKTTLVVIVKNSSTEIAKQAFDSFVNNIAIDTPDRQALTENPLSIPGF